MGKYGGLESTAAGLDREVTLVVEVRGQGEDWSNSLGGMEEPCAKWAMGKAGGGDASPGGDDWKRLLGVDGNSGMLSRDPVDERTEWRDTMDAALAGVRRLPGELRPVTVGGLECMENRLFGVPEARGRRLAGLLKRDDWPLLPTLRSTSTSLSSSLMLCMMRGFVKRFSEACFCFLSGDIGDTLWSRVPRELVLLTGLTILDRGDDIDRL